MLDAGTLQPDIKAAFLSAATAYGKNNSDAYLTTLSQKLAEAIVNHIKNDAEVIGGTCSPGGPISEGKIQ